MADKEDDAHPPIHGTAKHVFEFNLLDEATKKRVLECIQRKGKISVEIHHQGTAGLTDIGAGFKQLID